MSEEERGKERVKERRGFQMITVFEGALKEELEK
jgi:hypothetical protein